ncbi:uracil-DNA glycosylase [Candidatus Saccharibacteria bacterium]|nr:uracil-DNA glycosylase [Candidatus Saccharibacteria bacterium]
MSEALPAKLAINKGWREFLDSEFEKPYFKELSEFLKSEYASKTIYPSRDQVFSAFATDFNDIKVIIIGQDPYHGVGQAHGLSFSVNKGIKTPPSLQNMFKEIEDDLGKPIPDHGNLQHWADQGVLLLNNTLTVEAHKAGSHRNRGWETFTDAVITHLDENRENLVFLLWGRDARNKTAILSPHKHFILEAAHPSPFSAHSGFFGCRHFSKTNAYLRTNGLKEIDW